MKIGIATYCKGRSEHLKEVAPYLEAVKKKSKHKVEVHVLDYDCPQGTKEWVDSNTTFKCTKINNKPIFNQPLARNLSIQQLLDTDIILIIDCDIKIVDPLFIDNILKEDDLLNTFYSGREHSMAYGSCMVSTKNIIELSGYNEALGNGWGFDDVEFYNRLIEKGLTEKGFPVGSVDEIRHGDELRVLHYANKDIQQSNHLNAQCSSFQSIFIEDNIHYVCFYDIKRDSYLKGLHKEITERLGYNVTYVPTTWGHGDVITQYLHITNYANYLFIDIDCLPLVDEWELRTIIEKINKPLIGGVQNANHIKGSKDYIGAFFTYISKEAWVKAKGVPFTATNNEDVGGEVYRAITDSYGFYPIPQDNQPNRLDSGLGFGDGNTYLYNYVPIFYHEWGVRFAHKRNKFIDYCKSMIQKKPL
jgi:hypothetical protein